jgi:hypothetical protein
MMGTSIFMIRIAKAVPSGYAPKYLIKIVISPQPIPNMIFPVPVMGVVE